jgi:hypothetical protein
MSTSYLYTDKIVQPAHWSRVYPHVLIFAAAGLYGFQRALNLYEYMVIMKCVLCGVFGTVNRCSHVSNF